MSKIITGQIIFFVSNGSTTYEGEKDKANVRFNPKEDRISSIDIVLEEEDNWDRNYSIRCHKDNNSVVGAFHGCDDHDVRVSCNMINHKTVMGTWSEDGMLSPFIIKLD